MSVPEIPAPASAEREEQQQCWRCKTRLGVVFDGTSYECVECVGETKKRTREMLTAIDAALREGLTAWPRIGDRVLFVEECIKLHRRDAVAAVEQERKP